jgi:dihydrodipicolinate synthase/N-acetylneuraminate lyase
MSTFLIISAVGTPLNHDESLHEEGFAAHVGDQWQAGVNGILVCGTMGLMQLLADATYHRVVAAAASQTGPGRAAR